MARTIQELTEHVNSGSKIRHDPNPKQARYMPPRSQRGTNTVSVIYGTPLVATSKEKYLTISSRQLNTYQNREQMRQMRT